MTLGVYHPMFDLFTFAAEISDIEASNHAGADISNTAFSLGVMTSF